MQLTFIVSFFCKRMYTFLEKTAAGNRRKTGS